MTRGRGFFGCPLSSTSPSFTWRALVIRRTSRSVRPCRHATSWRMMTEALAVRARRRRRSRCVGVSGWPRSRRARRHRPSYTSAPSRRSPLRSSRSPTIAATRRARWSESTQMPVGLFVRGRPRRCADGCAGGSSGGPPGNLARPTSVSVDGTNVGRPSTSSQRPSGWRSADSGGTALVYREMPADAVNCGPFRGILTPTTSTRCPIGRVFTRVVWPIGQMTAPTSNEQSDA